MIKVISKTPVIPPSLIVTGVKMPVKRNYIGSGEFGCVFRGKLQGAAVALKLLYKSEDEVVSHSSPSCYKAVIDICANRPLSRSTDVAIPEAQVCASVVRNLRM